MAVAGSDLKQTQTERQAETDTHIDMYEQLN